jgi:hypothetical protein
VLDLVQPVRARRRLESLRGQHGRDEGGGTQNATHSANLCALSRIASQRRLQLKNGIDSPRHGQQAPLSFIHAARRGRIREVDL